MLVSKNDRHSQRENVYIWLSVSSGVNAHRKSPGNTQRHAGEEQPHGANQSSCGCDIISWGNSEVNVQEDRKRKGWRASVLCLRDERRAVFSQEQLQSRRSGQLAFALKLISGSGVLPSIRPWNQMH